MNGILAQYNPVRAGDQEELPVPEGAILVIDLVATTRQRMIEDAVGERGVQAHLRHRPSHSRATVGRAWAGMALSARLTSDELSLGVHIQKGTGRKSWDREGILVEALRGRFG